METLCHSHCYPSIPGSPDSASPIPDEYAYPNKGDGADKGFIPLETPLGFGADVFSIYNVPLLRLHTTTNSQHHNRSYQPSINRDTPTQKPNTPIPEKQGAISNRALESKQQQPTDPAASQSRPVQAPTHKFSSFGSSGTKVSEYNTGCTPRSQHFRYSSKYNMTSSSESRSQSSSDSSTKPSVKHLTCWWWYEKGQCRYSENDCLYAHHDTGLVADAPRQIKPGEPALAGRSLDRALRQVQQESSHGEKSTEIGVEPQNAAGEKTSIEEENRLLRTAYETLFAATSHSLEATTQFRRAFSKYSHELQSLEKASSASATNVADAAHIRAIDASNTDSSSKTGGVMATIGRLKNMISIQELASSMRGIEQKSLESGAAEWNTRAKISSIENMLGEAGMEDLVQSARKLARQ